MGALGQALAPYVEKAAAPRRGAAADRVAAILREAILDGALPPASWLGEEEIGRTLSVSRTPVREALRRLAHEGLTDRLPHRGTIVAALSAEDVLAVYLVRESLEGFAAHRAAIRQPPGLLEALEASLQGFASAVATGSLEAMTRENRGFHQHLRAAAGNGYLHRFLVQVDHAACRFGTTTFSRPRRPEAALAEHRLIASAVGRGDAAAAQRAAVAHMRAAREVRMAMLLDSGIR